MLNEKLADELVAACKAHGYSLMMGPPLTAEDFPDHAATITQGDEDNIYVARSYETFYPNDEPYKTVEVFGTGHAVFTQFNESGNQAKQVLCSSVEELLPLL